MSKMRIMNICVFGLWHLGTVTAACLARAGHQVVGLDPDVDTVRLLQSGKPPLFEPGLEELIGEQMQAGRLRFTTRPEVALRGAEIVWVTFDTPVDENDKADVEFVMGHVADLFPVIPSGALLLVSSQLPVGTTRQLEQKYRAQFPERVLTFAYSPENLRLGKAIRAFTEPDRVVVGVRGDAEKQRISTLFAPITDRIEWMSVESAEMTKHALNAFLATSVVFINELATLCEQVGADAREVECGLKSEARIGPGAYLKPGGAFAGGTLARDIAFLEALANQQGIPASLFTSIAASNARHSDWAYNRASSVLGDLHGKVIAVLGLTYKPGTSTLRRSSAVALCRKLLEAGALVHAHDPMVSALPSDLNGVNLSTSWEDALKGADALVIATEWPDYKQVTAALCVERMHTPVVIDANRFLAALESDARIRYYAVGKP